MRVFFSENQNIDAARCIKLSLLFVFLVICFGCSPKIKVSEESPPVFHLSGDNQLELFQISDESGAIWKIHPNANLTLNDTDPIKYGKLPPAWKQMIPQDSTPPPPLVEGKKYLAFAVILSADVLRVRFTIKEGKVLKLPEER